MDTPEATDKVEMERKPEPQTLSPFELNTQSWPGRVDLDVTPVVQKVRHPAETAPAEEVITSEHVELTEDEAMQLGLDLPSSSDDLPNPPTTEEDSQGPEASENDPTPPPF